MGSCRTEGSTRPKDPNGSGRPEELKRFGRAEGAEGVQIGPKGPNGPKDSERTEGVRNGSKGAAPLRSV